IGGDKRGRPPHSWGGSAEGAGGAVISPPRSPGRSAAGWGRPLSPTNEVGTGNFTSPLAGEVGGRRPPGGALPSRQPTRSAPDRAFPSADKGPNESVRQPVHVPLVRPAPFPAQQPMHLGARHSPDDAGRNLRVDAAPEPSLFRQPAGKLSHVL